MSEKGAESRQKALFSINVDPRMLSVHARLLKAPSVVYKGKIPFTPRLANWNMIGGKKFFESAETAEWSILNLSNLTVSKKDWETFSEARRSCGMKDTQPVDVLSARLPGLLDDDQNDEIIRNKIEDFSKKTGGILLVVLPSKSAPIYARVKFWADVKYGTV